MEPADELHYHITITSPVRNIPSIVTADRYTALTEFGKVLKLVQDLSGLPPLMHIDNEMAKEFNFLDQTKVRFWSCRQSCMHD